MHTPFGTTRLPSLMSVDASLPTVGDGGYSLIVSWITIVTYFIFMYINKKNVRWSGFCPLYTILYMSQLIQLPNRFRNQISRFLCDYKLKKKFTVLRLGRDSASGMPFLQELKISSRIRICQMGLRARSIRHQDTETAVESWPAR